jgi:hypothetical protein
MSWFQNDLAVFEHLDPDTRISDAACDEAVGEGVTVRRRSVLWLSVAGVGALLAGRSLPGQDPAGADPRATNGLSFAEFLREIFPLAQAQVREGATGEDTYLLSMASAMTRLAEPGTGERAAMSAFRRDHPGAGGRFPIGAAVMDLKPGGGFEPHDHRNYNGIILGLAGELRIRNFDILGDLPVPPKGITFQIRETRNDLILPGRFSMLGRRAENVHELVAGPQGARVLDLFTFYGTAAQSHYLTVDATPKDAERRVYDAAWA